MNEFPSVFIDNDKPEIVHGLDTGCGCSKPQPPKPQKDYLRKNPVINRPYSDKPIPGPFKPDYTLEPVGPSCAPNPVPNTYLAPGNRCCPSPPPHHNHCHPDRNMIPMEWENNHKYVTKHELNEVLRSIADADIFCDLSENGTTTSVGGIKKGTKFCHITFSRLVELMLYSKNAVDDEDYMCETPDGRTVLNSTVKYPIGGFKEGDSLKGLTISQIIEGILCERNQWGTYRWISDPIIVDPMTTTIDAEEVIPYLVSDYRRDRTFEIHVVGNDSVTSDNYIYDEIIAQRCNCNQKTNVTTEGVPSDIKWSYNPESKKITLHTDTEITSGITIVIVRR